MLNYKKKIAHFYQKENKTEKQQKRKLEQYH